MPNKRKLDAYLGDGSERLEHALKRVSKDRWENRRCYFPMMSQGMQAIEALDAAGFSTVEEVNPARLLRIIGEWVAEGYAASTINHRVNVLGLMGCNVTGCRRRLNRAPKWWLRPEDYRRIKSLFEESATEHELILLRYIEWAQRTGLRVEESLRITRGHFANDFWSITVPGTKNRTSGNVTLPISDVARMFALEVFNEDTHTRMLMFPISYQVIAGVWRTTRDRAGISHPGATLKALRRTAARYLHVDRGMPLDIVRQYLRHDNLDTTLGYLRLTGGYSEAEMRKYL